MDILALKIKAILSLLAICLFVFTTTSCSKTKNNSKKPNMEAIVDGTFATDSAMQEERIEQGNYIEEQEQRYR